MRRVKKILLIIAVVFVALLGTCELHQLLSHDENIPRGYQSCKENFGETAWGGDKTDYCWYQYNADSMSLPSPYGEVCESNIPAIKGYFDDCRNWLKTEDRLDQYDFNSACINEGDSMLLFTKEGQHIGSANYGKYDHYTLYFFDKETAQLYYIHSSI